VTNNAAVVGIDLATGREITAAQVWDASQHAITVDGALGAVGAPAELSSRDRAQLGDFETHASNNTAPLVVYERPGAGLSTQAPGLSNVRWRPIPQLPLMVTVPTQQLRPAEK
jgi:hypothetical protein